MARRRFFVDEVHSGSAEISGEDAKHLTRVLRVEAGQRYEISDNRSVYLAEIEVARKEQVVFRVIEKVPLRPPSVHITLFPALIKFDHLEWMIEKVTELGVDRIVPFPAARTEAGLERAAGKRVERWRKIAMEASQQCRRDRMPDIENAGSLADIAGQMADFRFLLDETPGAMPMMRALPDQRQAADTVGVALGPEGGWTEDERSRLEFAGWRPVSLGTQILRAETAAIAALAIVSAAWQAQVE
jgi:16S rRNA (uracil1498-N3)-methyltransferase